MKKVKNKEDLLFYTGHINLNQELKVPIATENISAGFPSPAENYFDGELDLNAYLVKNPPATFFVRVSGESMINAGINPKDILIVDRSLEVKNNDIIIAAIDGEFTVKRFSGKNNTFKLIAENPDYKNIEITSETDFEIWGVVTNVIHGFRK
ncbi:MAG: translesion error-prone DNA polymerase V autoproteolytic subunit [Victivallales bacterium]|nr:translesion error-prone DNA polymerase V autoproteolytic subunit [Victivallales bacterium]